MPKSAMSLAVLLAKAPAALKNVVMFWPTTANFWNLFDGEALAVFPLV